MVARKSAISRLCVVVVPTSMPFANVLLCLLALGVHCEAWGMKHTLPAEERKQFSTYLDNTLPVEGAQAGQHVILRCFLALGVLHEHHAVAP